MNIIDSHSEKCYIFAKQLRGSSQTPTGGFEIVNRYREVSVSNETARLLL